MNDPKGAKTTGGLLSLVRGVHSKVHISHPIIFNFSKRTNVQMKKDPAVSRSRIVDIGHKRVTMAVHEPSGVGVVAASTHRRAILVLLTVIEAVFISQWKRLSTWTYCVWTRASDLTVSCHPCCYLRDRAIDEGFRMPPVPTLKVTTP